MKVTKSPDDAAARTNCVFASPVDFNGKAKYVVLADRCPMTLIIDQRVVPGEIGTTLFQRKFVSVSVNQEINVRVFEPEKEGCLFLSTLTLSVIILIGNLSKQNA